VSRRVTVADLAASGRTLVEDPSGQLRALLPASRADGAGSAPCPGSDAPARTPAPGPVALADGQTAGMTRRQPEGARQEDRPPFLPKPRKPRAPLRERVAELLRWRRTRPRRRLQPEEAVQTQTVAMFDAAFLAGADVLLVSLANEVRLPLPTKEEAGRDPDMDHRRRWLQRVAEEFGRLALAMGVCKGACDSILLFRHRETGRGVVGFLEAKRPGGQPRWSTAGGKVRQVASRPGTLEPEQETFCELAWSWGLPVAVYRSPEEAREIARGWGAPV
jgi:hypothetical protein